MPAKKSTTKKKATTTKSPRKRSAKTAAAVAGDGPLELPNADDAEAKIASMHERAAAGEDLSDSSVPADPDAQPVVREGPSEEDAEQVAAEYADTSLSTSLARALRFVTNDSPFVQLYPNIVIGTGPRGSVYAPWQAPNLRPEGHVVDGKRLHRVLRAAGPAAELNALPDGSVQVKAGTRRFKLAAWGGEVVSPIPIPSDISWVVVDPLQFQRAARFAGDDKIEPPYLSGVHVRHGAVMATDRRGLIWCPGFTESVVEVTLPKDAFDAIAQACYFGVHPSTGHAFIGDTVTGEYRALVPWGSSYPDVKHVVDHTAVAFEVALEKQAFAAALKQMWLVQSRVSSVKLWVFRNEEGEWVEMRGGDPSSMAELVVRLGASFAGAVPEGMFKIMVSGELLVKLAQSALGDTVRVGFDHDRAPVSLAGAAHRVIVMPMVE